MLVLQLINTGGRKRIKRLNKSINRLNVTKSDESVTLFYSDGSEEVIPMREHMFNFEADRKKSKLHEFTLSDYHNAAHVEVTNVH